MRSHTTLHRRHSQRVLPALRRGQARRVRARLPKNNYLHASERGRRVAQSVGVYVRRRSGRRQLGRANASTENKRRPMSQVAMGGGEQVSDTNDKENHRGQPGRSCAGVAAVASKSLARSERQDDHHRADRSIRRQLHSLFRRRGALSPRPANRRRDCRADRAGHVSARHHRGAHRPYSHPAAHRRANRPVRSADLDMGRRDGAFGAGSHGARYGNVSAGALGARLRLREARRADLRDAAFDIRARPRARVEESRQGAVARKRSIQGVRFYVGESRQQSAAGTLHDRGGATALRPADCGVDRARVCGREGR